MPKANKAIGKQIRDWHLNRRSATDLAGLAGAINAQVRGWRRGGCRQLLRGLLPLRVVCHRSAHRRTSCSMGDAEVQTIASLSRLAARVASAARSASLPLSIRPTHQSMEMARRCPSARATTLRSLAPPRFNPTPDCGSRMTGDCPAPRARTAPDRGGRQHLLREREGPGSLPPLTVCPEGK